jgi:hypothetical protein
MAFNVFCDVRTVGQISNLTKFKDKKGEEVSFITFKVVSNREYKSNFKIGDKAVNDYQSDFIFCKAVGNIADMIERSKEVQSTKEYKGVVTNKYKSIHIALRGKIETYTKARNAETITKIVTISGNSAKVEFKPTMNVLETILSVDHIEFLDKNPRASLKAGVTDGEMTVTPILAGGTEPTALLPQAPASASVSDVPKVGSVPGEVTADVIKKLAETPVVELDAEGNPVVELDVNGNAIIPTPF